MSIPIVVCCAGKVAAPVAGLSDCEAALARGSMGNIFTGDPLHSRAACTQPCNVNTHSRAHCSPGARLCEQWEHGCVNNGARLCASARLCRGSPVILRIQTYDFIDLYSVSVIALKCAISCYMGLRYNINLVISFMNVMPVLWHVPVCVWHAELVGYVVREKIDRVKTAPHCNWLNALSTTS